jgi:hypothetical protein
MSEEIDMDTLEVMLAAGALAYRIAEMEHAQAAGAYMGGRLKAAWNKLLDICDATEAHYLVTACGYKIDEDGGEI